MKIFRYLLCVCCLGCNAPEKPGTRQILEDTTAKRNEPFQPEERLTAKSIDDLQKYIWSPHHPDTTGYLCEMSFRDEYAMVFFHGQCIYFFFTYTTHAENYQQVQLEWTYKTDCLLNMSFLENANGAKLHPKRGDIFSTYRLINDTTLDVEYRFPEWIQKVNLIAKDSLFPRRLYLRRPAGA